VKRRILAIMAIVGLAGFAGTCQLLNTSFNTIGTHDTFGGELRNDTGVNFLGHNVLVAFLNANNEVVETKTVAPCLRSFQNGRSDFFSATSSQPASATTFALARIAFDSALKVGDTADGDLSFSNIRVARNGTTLKVTGTVKNLDSDELADPTICVVVYNSGDDVVLVAKNTSVADLSHNETADWQITATVPSSATTVDHIDVWADGLEGGTPIAPESSTGIDVTQCTPTSTPANTTTATATASNTPTSTPTGTPPATNTPGAATSTPTPNLCL